MLDIEHDVNKNAWSNKYCKYRYEKCVMHLQWQRIEELGQVFLPQKYTF